MVSIDILKRSTINTVRYTYSIDKIYTEFIELQGNQHFQFSLPIINLILLIPQSFTLTLLCLKRRHLKVFWLLVLYTCILNLPTVNDKGKFGQNEKDRWNFPACLQYYKNWPNLQLYGNTDIHVQYMTLYKTQKYLLN